MKITIDKVRSGESAAGRKWNSFTVEFATSPDKKPFITVHGCSLKNGINGDFTSCPQKQDAKDQNKWWDVVYMSRECNAEVTKLALVALRDHAPPDPRTHAERKRPPVEDDDIPF